MGRNFDVGQIDVRGSRVRFAVAASMVLLAGLVAAGCGSSADDANASGVPTLGFMTWRDPSGLDEKNFRMCEKQSGGKYRIAGVPMGPSVDQAREQLTRRLAAGDSSIDMINLDVIWTAEFSDAHWITDLSARMKPLKDQYVPAALESTFYKGKYWAVPVGTNAALLYYRTDLVKKAPKTWEEMARDIKKVHTSKPDLDGFVFQGASYEGGTVDVTEFLLGAGAKILDKSGKKVLIDQGDGAEYALGWLRDLMKSGLAPKVVTTYMEEDTRLSFQKGDAIFMRNWPYSWALMNQDKASKVKGKFGIAPLPGFDGRSQASVLGGQNYGIAASSKHPDLAWQAMMCLSSAAVQRIKAVKKGEMPTLQALYTDGSLDKDVPFLGVISEGLKTGVNRPATPYYNDSTIVLYKAYNDVLNGRLSPKDAVKRMQHSLQAAVNGKAEI